MSAVLRWDEIFQGRGPCPLTFTEEELSKTLEMGEVLDKTDARLARLYAVLGFESDRWVSVDRYDSCVEMARSAKERLLSGASPERREIVAKHCFRDSYDEEPNL